MEGRGKKGDEDGDGKRDKIKSERELLSVKVRKEGKNDRKGRGGTRWYYICALRPTHARTHAPKIVYSR